MKYDVFTLVFIEYFFSCAETVQIVKENAESKENKKSPLLPQNPQ